MAFIENPRFPDELAYWLQGGPRFHTTIAQLFSGNEQRTIDWNNARMEYSMAEALRTTAQVDALLAYFRVLKGMGYGFRVKDFADFTTTQDGTVAGSTGIMGTTGVGNGGPSYQMYRQYSTGGLTDTRKIRKPVAGATTQYRGGVALVAGGGAGQFSLDTTSGIMTMVADSFSGATSITPGATTSVNLTANPGGLVAGKLLYLSGFAGADAALVNNIAHVINSVSGAGPFTFVLATNTAGKTITLGSGLGSKYPQASETMTWAGTFDVPVRMNDDWLQAGFEKEGTFNWVNGKLIEIFQD